MHTRQLYPTLGMTPGWTANRKDANAAFLDAAVVRVVVSVLTGPAWRAAQMGRHAVMASAAVFGVVDAAFSAGMDRYAATVNVLTTVAAAVPVGLGRSVKAESVYLNAPLVLSGIQKMVGASISVKTASSAVTERVGNSAVVTMEVAASCVVHRTVPVAALLLEGGVRVTVLAPVNHVAQHVVSDIVYRQNGRAFFGKARMSS